MTLQEIETYVLMNFGGKRYNKLSAAASDTNDGRDFALLHRCVFLARNHLKLHTTIPSIMKRSEANKTTANTKAYNLPTDFDVPVRVRYRTNSSEFDLDRVYSANLKQKLGSNLTTSVGTPSLYMIFGNDAAAVERPRIELYLIPERANQEFDVIYKPIFSNLIVATAEDIVMARYPKTIINLATAFAFQIFKKGKQFSTWLAIGERDFSTINQRETAADSAYKTLPDRLIRRKRSRRFSR